jgi:26S proteasome regulatory subunit N6
MHLSISFSYFFESFESFNSLENPKAIYPLKYMILSKIMQNATDDIHAILSGKNGLKYAGKELEAMKSVTEAHSHRSLKEFQKVLGSYEQGIVMIQKPIF